MTTQIIVGLLMVLTLAGAALAVWLRQALHAVFGLGVALMGVAGLYFALGSPFVGLMQILIYIGGIGVLLVFAVMLATSLAAPRPPRRFGKTALALSGAVLFFAALCKPLLGTVFPAPATPPSAEAWSVAELGHTLLGPYLLVFEALSLLLVIAIMGAILIAHKEEEQP